MGATAMIYRDGCRATIAPGAQNVTPARAAQPHYRVTDAETRSQIHTPEGCFLSGEEQSYTPGTLSLISGNIALSTVDGKLDIRRTRRALRVLRKDFRQPRIGELPMFR